MAVVPGVKCKNGGVGGRATLHCSAMNVLTESPVHLLSWTPAPVLAAWLHDLDPFAIRFTGDFGIRWYGLSYLLGFALGYLLVRRVVTVGISTLKPQHVADLIVTLAIGIVVGGRLGYCVFYRPELLITFYDYLPWWGVLAINEGGMASHGGMIGGIIAAFIFARRHHHDLPHLLDLFAFGTPLGLFFGRLANFWNGELLGRPARDLPWAVKFPQELWDRPEAAYHAMSATGLDSVSTIIEAVQRGDDRVRAVVEPILIPRHPSQLYAAVMEGLVVFAVLLWVWRVPRKPGVVASSFSIAYGVMRIVDEFFRRPDVHLMDAEFAVLGITRGQWLSVLLVCVGLWGIWWSRRRDTTPMGGWRRIPAVVDA